MSGCSVEKSAMSGRAETNYAMLCAEPIKSVFLYSFQQSYAGTPDIFT